LYGLTIISGISANETPSSGEHRANSEVGVAASGDGVSVGVGGVAVEVGCCVGVADGAFSVTCGVRGGSTEQAAMDTNAQKNTKPNTIFEDWQECMDERYPSAG